MAQRLPITVRLDTFEGPLDLLLYLIQTHELDITKVTISRITDQYLAYVGLMQELNFDIASEFLVMAATLVFWKSRTLLPQERDATAPEEGAEQALTPDELIRRLIEHRRFKKAGEDLLQLHLLGQDVFVRNNRRPPVDKAWKTLDVTSLALTYQDMLRRERKRSQVLRKETVSLSIKIMDLRERLKLGVAIELKQLLQNVLSRPETVVTFLAGLELARLKKLRLIQEGTYQSIYFELIAALEESVLDLATGFDSATSAASPGSTVGAPALGAVS